MYKLYQMNDNKYHARITSYLYSVWIPYFLPPRGMRAAAGPTPPVSPAMQCVMNLTIQSANMWQIHLMT